MSAERKFLFFENKFCFRFFIRKVACLNSFYTKSRIFFIRKVGYNKAFIKRLRKYNKDCVRFFLVFCKKKTGSIKAKTTTTENKITATIKAKIKLFQ